MSYHIFLDDERLPNPKAYLMTDQVIIARDSDQFKGTILTLGMPKSIAFDHDLGYSQPTGYDCLRWLIDHFIDNKFTIDKWPEITSHSMNPVGKKNILTLAYNFLASMEKEIKS